MPAESMDGDIYIAADVNIVFFTEEALQMLHRGQKVIILPNPDKSVYDEALRKLRERFPGINQASREIIDLVREDWGR
jgi:hypothetical protein